MKKLLLISMIAVFILTSCSNIENRSVKSTEFLLGTVCTIKIYGSNDEKILDEAFDEIRRIEGLISTALPDSEISTINDNSGISAVKVSKEVYGLVKTALGFTLLSEGAFNVAAGPLVKLWGIGTENARVPSGEEIEETIPLLDHSGVILDDAEMTVYLRDSGMALDLGAIAKGYIADRIVELLLAKGIKSALINLGGNIYALGLKPGGDEWLIGIQDPFGERNDYFAVYKAEDETIVSSGIYERYFEYEGVRYHHIFDCSTGYPVMNDICSATVIGKKSETADALSTIIFSLGAEKGIEFAAMFPGYEVILVDKKMNVFISKGLKDIVEVTGEGFAVTVHE